MIEIKYYPIKIESDTFKRVLWIMEIILILFFLGMQFYLIKHLSELSIVNILFYLINIIVFISIILLIGTILIDSHIYKIDLKEESIQDRFDVIRLLSGSIAIIGFIFAALLGAGIVK